MKNKTKIISAAVISAVLALNGLAFSACSAGCRNAVETSQTQTDDGTTTNSQTVNPSSPSYPDGGSSDGNSKLKLSSITYNLMTDDYYLDFARKAMLGYTTITKEMLPIPFKFLREKGKNVDAYLNGTLNAFASSYMYTDDLNNLYVSVKAENLSSSTYGNYYTNYVLKYPLTNQESEEFLYLCKNGYLQGLLFIQELDIQKKPEIVSEVNISVDTYNTIIKRSTNSPNINIDKYLKVEADVRKATMDELSVDIRKSATSTYEQAKKYNLNVALVAEYAGSGNYENNVYHYFEPTAGDISFDDYLSSSKNIISFGYGQRIKHFSPYIDDYPIKINNNPPA